MKDSFQLQPGVPHRLDDAVTRIIAPNGGVMTGAGTNTYLVGTEELIVVDPGPDEEAHMRAILAQAGGRIRWIVCTHTHFDHAPAAATLKRLTGAPIAAMAPPRTDHDFPLQPERILADGDTVECADARLLAIHTPGHASNHICFLFPANGMLFTGDHIMQGSTVVIWPPDGNMRAYIASLRNLLAVEIAAFAPGHGHLIDNPRAELNRLIQHRLRREEKVRRAVMSAGADVAAEALLPSAYDDVPESLYKWAAYSLQAHLDKLVEDGELCRADGRYSPRR